MNNLDLFGSLLDQLGEIKSKKESDDLYLRAWSDATEELTDSEIRQIYFDIENLLESKERGKIFHIAEETRRFFTQVSFTYASLKRNESPVPIQWPK